MWKPQHLTTLWASTACYRDSFAFFTQWTKGCVGPEHVWIMWRKERSLESNTDFSSSLSRPSSHYTHCANILYARGDLECPHWLTANLVFVLRNVVTISHMGGHCSFRPSQGDMGGRCDTLAMMPTDSCHTRLLNQRRPRSATLFNSVQ
jgi:hypothetical protein